MKIKTSRANGNKLFEKVFAMREQLNSYVATQIRNYGKTTEYGDFGVITITLAEKDQFEVEFDGGNRAVVRAVSLNYHKKSEGEHITLSTTEFREWLLYRTDLESLAVLAATLENMKP